MPQTVEPSPARTSGWTEPTLDSGVWLPMLGFSVSLGLGAWVMCLGPHRRRWLWVAIVTTVVGAVGLGLITWVSVLLA